ncbi:MAG: hypothetical protein OXL68_15195 [Paracoccaceae bacterium]|nr:hypothetical protein [Paracoccaceae bacterium]
MGSKTQQEEVDRNYEAFKKVLPELVKTDAKRFALMHDKEVVACFDTSRDALQAGQKLFEGQHFSIQEITMQAVDLGYFSHAGFLRAV